MLGLQTNQIGFMISTRILEAVIYIMLINNDRDDRYILLTNKFHCCSDIYLEAVGASFARMPCRGSAVQQAVSALTQLPTCSRDQASSSTPSVSRISSPSPLACPLTRSTRYRILDRSQQPLRRFHHLTDQRTKDGSDGRDGCRT